MHAHEIGPLLWMVVTHVGQCHATAAAETSGTCQEALAVSCHKLSCELYEIQVKVCQTLRHMHCIFLILRRFSCYHTSSWPCCKLLLLCCLLIWLCCNCWPSPICTFLVLCHLYADKAESAQHSAFVYVVQQHSPYACSMHGMGQQCVRS